MNTAPTWRPIDLGAVFKRIDRRFKWIGDHDVIFLVVFGLLFFAFSDVLMAGRLTPAGNSLSFIAAVLWSVLGLVFLVVAPVVNLRSLNRQSIVYGPSFAIRLAPAVLVVATVVGMIAAVLR